MAALRAPKGEFQSALFQASRQIGRAFGLEALKELGPALSLFDFEPEKLGLLFALSRFRVNATLWLCLKIRGSGKDVETVGVRPGEKVRWAEGLSVRRWWHPAGMRRFPAASPGEGTKAGWLAGSAA